MSKTILRIDASLLKESSCDERVVKTLVEGYRSPLWNNDVEFGTAFHLFVSTMKRVGNEGLALKAARDYFSTKPMIIKPKKKYLTTTYLSNICLSYWQKVGEVDEFDTLKSQSGEPLVEQKFALPYYADDEFEVILCGTIDDICKHRHGTYGIRDYKTTSSWSWEEYLKEYDMSTQLKFYRYLISLYAKLYPDSILAELDKKGVSCFIEGVFLNGADKFDFHRSDMITFTEEAMIEYAQLLHNKVIDIVAMARKFKSGLPTSRIGLIEGLCFKGFGCPFADACKATDNVIRGHVLKNNFTRWDYDPSKFGGTEA